MGLLKRRWKCPRCRVKNDDLNAWTKTRKLKCDICREPRPS